MKKIFILLFLATATTFLSCNKDDDNGETTAELLIGSWELTQQGMVMDGTEALEPYEHEAPECGKDYILFESDNTGTNFEYYNESGCQTDIEQFTYTLNGMNMTVTFEDNSVRPVTIMSINNSTLKIKFTEDFLGTPFEFILVMSRK